MTNKFPSASVLGIPISCLNIENSTEVICSMVEAYKKDLKPRYVATANVDFLVHTHSWFSPKPQNPELLNALRNADMITPDGMPICWYLQAMGQTKVSRVSGIDLLLKLANAASEKGYSIFLLGGTDDAAKKASINLTKKYPSLKIAGIASPTIHIGQQDRAIIEKINQAAPDILLINLGNPKQEIWFQRNQHQLAVPISIGVGGSFNFLAGKVARAPKALQNFGLEWIYRLYQEPKRLWKRYCIDLNKGLVLTLPPLLYHLWKKMLLRKKLKANNQIHKKTSHHNGQQVTLIELPPYLSDQTSTMLYSLLLEEQHNQPLVLDFKKTQHIEIGPLAIITQLFTQQKVPVYNINDQALSTLFRLNKTWDLLTRIF